MSKIDYLPIWKKGATPAERFSELESIARKYPERFAKIAIIYEETLPSGCTVIRQASNACSTTELIGLLELGKVQVIRETE